MADKKEDQKDIMAQLQETKDALKALQGKHDEIQGKLTTAEGEVTRLTSENTKLTGENTRLTGENTKLTGENTKLTGENTGLKNDVTRLTGENTKLTEDNTKLQESQKDFDGKLRLKLIEHGVRVNAVTAPIGEGKKADGSKMSLTEQCLAEKGKQK